MSFNWDDFIDLGRELHDGKNNHAKLRTSLSRGYYGIYHKTIKKLGLENEDYISHKFLREKLANSSLAEANRLSQMLRHLFDARVKADYKGKEVVDMGTLNDFWNRLDFFIKKLNK